MSGAAIEQVRPAPPAPFGTVFAGHMSVAQFREGRWSAPRVRPLEALALHPGAHVLHYASACFEGLKAFRRADGGAGPQTRRLREALVALHSGRGEDQRGWLRVVGADGRPG